MSLESISTASWRNKRARPAEADLQPAKAIYGFMVWSICAVFCALFTFSCDTGGEDEILIFAAASLTDVLNELAEDYREESGVNVTFNFGGSQLLARQIVEGAPADVMISAGPKPFEMLMQERLLEDLYYLISNELVVVTRHDFSLKLDDLTGLRSTVFTNISVPDPELAPAGTYAKEALTTLGLWEELSGKILPTSDVRSALTNVERGNSEAAVVYRTDALVGHRLSIFDIVPSASHSAILYPVAIIVGTKKRQAANKFVTFLLDKKAQLVFADFGFKSTSAAGE